MSRMWQNPAPGVWLAYVTGPITAGEYVSVPDGRCGLAWVDDRVWWLGPSTRPWRAGRALDAVVGIRFDDGAGRLFAGSSLHEWRDGRVDLRRLPGHAAEHDDLVVVLRGAGSPDRQARALASYASRAVGGRAAPPTTVGVYAAAALGRPVASAAAMFGLSTRQFHRRHLAEIGMPPTTLRRIRRLHAAAAVSANTPPLSIAEIAAGAGYADQAHLARETRALTLSTPSEALRAATGVRSVQDRPSLRG